jgi:ketosteroid isomerase-like protein
VTAISPDCAVLAADGEFNATLGDGTNVMAPFTQTLVFVRRNGEWKLLHAHYSAPMRR